MTDRDTKILELYQSGLLIKAIAAEVGMAPNSIGSILKRLGVTRPTKPQKRWRGRPDDENIICELWKQGLCVSQISERLGTSFPVINRILSAKKIRTGPPRHRYDSAVGGGSGKDGFAGNMARKI